MKYEVWFKLANEEKESIIDFNEAKYKDAIVGAIKKFNKSGSTARNKKNIYGNDIQKNIIKIFFDSDIELEMPTKSFRFFSKELIDNSEAFRNLVIGGRLLKGVYAGEVKENQNKQEIGLMSDEQMLQTLLHWCMTKEIQSVDEKKNKLATIEKIKELISECLVISQ